MSAIVLKRTLSLVFPLNTETVAQRWSVKKLFLAKDYIAKFTPHFPHVLCVGNTLMDLVLFTTRVAGTSDTSATRVTRMRQECDTSNTSATRVPDTNDTSATRVKNFDFVTTRVKIYFHTLIFTIWQVKEYKERKNFILRTTFWKCLFSMPKSV